ncbi:MAG TPA: DNA mismatch repair endonuclease MutL [Bellilinea sp.]|nr:DNA mismatch repair endonuclease MutL [Bellilinea sp.]
MPIRILADEVASQIAAGEVIERPASVVKELLENALDAGASKIDIRIEQAGRRLIEISDDGAGIAYDEMLLALARHATSKLQTADDLFHIRSLGFRGEALASIGSVSRATLISQVREVNLGGRIRVEGGKILTSEHTGAPVGTVVRVEDLFYNVPARLKFLKTDQTERNQINNLVTRYALAYSQVRFRLVQDGKLALQTNGNNDRREILTQLYGIEIARQMLEVTLEDADSKISGFISPVGLTRSNRREMTFFVNGRWVSDPALSSALLQAYHTLLMVGRYPLAVLFIDLAPEEVDVNVHPAKAEVRFRSPDAVFSLVQRAVKRALLAYSPTPQISTTYWQTTPSTQTHLVDPAWEMAGDLQGQDLTQFNGPDSTAENDPQAQPALPSGELPLLRPIGQVGAAYLVAEGPDGLYLIDQHAAHERVLFERLMRQREKTIPAQHLLEPVTLQLPPAAALLLSGQLAILNSLGFQVEDFGPNTFRIRAIPAILIGADPEAAVRVVVEDFEEDETPLQTEIEERIIARVCKRVAVKAGKTLSMDEQKALVRDLENCQSPRTCPHGRPTMIHLSVDLLERQFGRRGARNLS